MNGNVDDQDLALGPLLRRLRGETSLRAVHRLTGISYPYLSQIEQGHRQPGPRLLQRLAALYGVPVHDLLQRAGHLEDGGEPPPVDETQEVERAYQYVLADPQFRLGTRPRGPLSAESKRFIVEMYQHFTGKRLLP